MIQNPLAKTAQELVHHPTVSELQRTLNVGGLWFKSLPFPPSVNHLRHNVVMGRRIVPIKTKVYRDYEKQMALAMLRQKKPIGLNPMSFYAYLYAPKSFWFTKAGTAKRADADNYLKALIDAFCLTLEIDDKWFFELHVFKAQAEEMKVDIFLSEKLTSTVVAL